MKCYLCAGNNINFRLTNGCSYESVEVCETEYISTWGRLETPTFGFIPNALTIRAMRARYLLSHRYIPGGLLDDNSSLVQATSPYLNLSDDQDPHRIYTGESLQQRVSDGAWWRHQIKTFSVLLALCKGNPPVTGDTMLRCFLWSVVEQTVEQTIETPMIWDAIALIMTSL